MSAAPAADVASVASPAPAPSPTAAALAAFVSVGAAIESSIDALLKAETLRAERDAARRERAGVAKVEAGVAARAAALLRGIREDEGIC